MSLHYCPTCRRSFDQDGFCPFDRSALVSETVIDKQTLLSAAIPAAVPLKTEVDQTGPKHTAPWSPTPGTNEITAARARAPSGSVQAQVVRALSASEDPAQVLEAFKIKHDDYDRLVGQTLDGRYFIERKIGEGGMGVVFAARHSVIERPLAIKVLKREVMRDTATIKRFVQEAKAASRIGHPNIVDVTDFGTTPDGMTYSVMEFITGTTLGTAIRESAPFRVDRALKITAQIARALGAAHDKGIVHRDLKPENVFLVDRDGRTDFVKIVDFGIAKVVPVGGVDPNAPRLTRAGSVFGTPEYMAPEQAAGRSDTDGRVDIYALGVILYEMLVARVPHKGDSTVRTLAMQMLDPVQPPSEVRPDLEIRPEVELLVLRALAKKREARFQTMGDLLASIETLQTVVGTSVTGSPVYALMPLPPGADEPMSPSSIDSALPSGVLRGPAKPDLAIPTTPVPMAVPATAPPPSFGDARSKAPTNNPPILRRAHEPQFVTGERPATFEHVFTEENPVGRPPRRWPLLLFLGMIAGGAAGAIALVAKSRSNVIAESSHDAGIVTPPPPQAPDAAVVVEVPGDAAVVGDAADIVVVEPDAGRVIAVRPPPRHVDAGVGVTIRQTPNGRGTISIQVLTKPGGAQLYVGQSYRGPDGANLEEALDAKLEVQCRLRGYKPGNVTLVFDGKTELAMCTLTRIKICVKPLKNPFDDCETDPNAKGEPMPD